MSKRWSKSMLAGSYVSDTGQFAATLCKPGVYNGVKMVRHYAITPRGSDVVIARPRTLKDAEVYL